jgi:hypothetical protein
VEKIWLAGMQSRIHAHGGLSIKQRRLAVASFAGGVRFQGFSMICRALWFCLFFLKRKNNFKGLFTALFVFSTHYPEDRVPAGANHMSLLEQTAFTSRNIGGGAIVNWMSGGISLQVIH